jgi:predicted NAD-dependent protein-ADP-ribosyltransferase YbiA (DUF1768 family)
MGGPAIVDGKSIKELDNFYECKFMVDSIEFCSSENYFQCMKTTNEKDFNKVLNSGPGMLAWDAGNRIKLRHDWELVKVKAMYLGNKAKIEQNSEIKNLICETVGPIQCTQSTDFWNKWNSRILTLIRAELRNAGEEDVKIAQEIRELMSEYEEDNK